MDKYIGDILTGADTDTRNDSFAGITRNDALRYANYAQDHLFSAITRKYPYSFVTSKIRSIVAGQEYYAPVDKIYLGTRIIKVEYSADGVNNWQRVLPTNPYARSRLRTGRPYYYHRENGQIRIEPIQQSAQGFLKIYYERDPDRLDLRRAVVSVLPTGPNISLVSVDSSVSFTSGQYICISDFYGTPLLYNGVILGYSSPIITLAADASAYMVSGFNTSDLVGKYVTVGKYTSTHSSLDNTAERYISEYVTRRMYKRDARVDESAITKELLPIESDIIAAYEIADEEVKGFPIIDHDVLVFPYETKDWYW